MRTSDLDFDGLLDRKGSGGTIRFAGERALLLDAVALGLLRKELIGTFGRTVARGVLTRLGYAHGWRAAEALKDAIPWDSDREWRAAGGSLQTLQGLVVWETAAEPRRDAPPGPRPLVEAIWKESYEAEQHVLHAGVADEPVCWTLVGFASGYLSRAHGSDVYVVEEACRGRGDAVCRVVGRTGEDWGEAIAPHLPFYERDCLEDALRRVRDVLKRTERRLTERRRQLETESRAEDVEGLVARSEPMRRVLAQARRIAPLDTNVLLTGESGSGKERLAQLVHRLSARAGGPFVAVNCGAVPEGLLESELFGHARGAFTGAATDRAGLFEAANGGTLFLDEVGELPLSMQVKLLRAVQEREVRRVGENRSRPVDIRLLAATNQDLPREVVAGRFRQDLYYRLRVVEIRIPPLRERPDDILPLARTLLGPISRRLGRSVRGLAPEAARALLTYPWPGNVRELENALERAVAFARSDRIDVGDLPEELDRAASLPRPPAPATGTIRPLAEVERETVLAALAATGGNRAEAARRLGIGTATLFRKLKQWAVEAHVLPRLSPP